MTNDDDDDNDDFEDVDETMMMIFNNIFMKSVNTYGPISYMVMI